MHRWYKQMLTCIITYQKKKAILDGAYDDETEIVNQFQLLSTIAHYENKSLDARPLKVTR